MEAPAAMKAKKANTKAAAPAAVKAVKAKKAKKAMKAEKIDPAKKRAGAITQACKNGVNYPALHKDIELLSGLRHKCQSQRNALEMLKACAEKTPEREFDQTVNLKINMKSFSAPKDHYKNDGRYEAWKAIVHTLSEQRALGNIGDFSLEADFIEDASLYKKMNHEKAKHALLIPDRHLFLR